jgi:hypothetical protein
VNKFNGPADIVKRRCKTVVSCGNHKVINPIGLGKEGMLLTSNWKCIFRVTEHGSEPGNQIRQNLPGTKTLGPESHTAHSMLRLPGLQVPSNVEHHLGKEQLQAKYTADRGRIKLDDGAFIAGTLIDIHIKILKCARQQCNNLKQQPKVRYIGTQSFFHYRYSRRLLLPYSCTHVHPPAPNGRQQEQARVT